MKYSLRFRLAKVLRKIGFNFDAQKNEAVKNMKKTISKLDGGKIIFQVTIDKDGNWAAEALNLNGLITGGYITDNFNDMITDAIFTYFNIPPEYCDDSLLIKGSKKRKKTSGRKIFTISQTPTPAMA